ncbi:ATR-interacting protein [Lates japonicus]|uniref:ATR-interacting protein n=1 Tax=Lates japonicus TaxID=270547 RepID=A0AAD3R784_LATJO|nr:ATR-interacting protein [Lates japonicus]
MLQTSCLLANSYQEPQQQHREISMNCPPTKRLRGLNHEVATAVAFDDPFGDDEDFTQDDLDEIDIIASQAITSAAAGARIGSKPESKQVDLSRGAAWSASAGQNKPLNKATTKQSRENTFGFSSSNRGNAAIQGREPLGNRQQQFGSDRDDSYSLLEAQHAELKRKLKEVEEEIVLKSGEIRVLRDSLKAAQQEKEAQRQNQVLLETQRQREQSDREKELNKKVQSLQSELQFKEAEINEMKTKLHNSDRNKMASPLPRNSPKVLSSLAQLHHGRGSSSSSSSPTGNGFITKEMFGAQIPSRTTPVKTPIKTRRDADRGVSSSRYGDSRQEVSRPDPFLSVRPAHLQHRGGVLLGLLLQQPLSPSSLSLSHLLSMSLTDIHLTASDEVVEAVLSKQSQSRVTDDKPDSSAGVGLCSQNALLHSVLRLCEAGLRGSSSSSSSSQREELVLSAMKTLCVLIERTPQSHTDRLQCVVQVVCACLSADSRLQMISQCVSVLMSMSDHQTLAQQLCSHHDPCVFLKLFQVIRTRPDNQATHTDWILLDLQVVRLLNRLMSQRAESWTSNLHSSCQCYTELVQTVVIVFHRQWLDLRGSQELTNSTAPSGLPAAPPQCSAPSSPWWCSPAASLLRECLLLLHWLLLHHGSFSESCRPLLHMYDQVIPAVRDTLRKIPELSESEELALEEICRSEGDDTDDMDTDTGS